MRTFVTSFVRACSRACVRACVDCVRACLRDGSASAALVERSRSVLARLSFIRDEYLRHTRACSPGRRVRERGRRKVAVAMGVNIRLQGVESI
eukprot:6203632-Pleurochrysis_carterae.AAC.1